MLVRTTMKWKRRARESQKQALLRGTTGTAGPRLQLTFFELARLLPPAKCHHLLLLLPLPQDEHHRPGCYDGVNRLRLLSTLLLRRFCYTTTGHDGDGGDDDDGTPPPHQHRQGMRTCAKAVARTAIMSTLFTGTARVLQEPASSSD